MHHEVTDFWTWLMAWAPTIWYGMAVAGFWVGSGAFVFRSLLRAWHSPGLQQRADEGSSTVPVVWDFASVWVLILAAVLGPLGSPLFAVVYVYFTLSPASLALQARLGALARGRPSTPSRPNSH